MRLTWINYLIMEIFEKCLNAFGRCWQGDGDKIWWCEGGFPKHLAVNFNPKIENHSNVRDCATHRLFNMFYLRLLTPKSGARCWCLITSSNRLMIFFLTEFHIQFWNGFYFMLKCFERKIFICGFLQLLKLCFKIFTAAQDFVWSNFIWFEKFDQNFTKL